MQDDVDQRADVLGMKTLAEVQAEAIIARRARGFIQDAGEVDRGDESVRARKQPTVEPERTQDVVGIPTRRFDGLDQSRGRGERDQRPPADGPSGRSCRALASVVQSRECRRWSGRAENPRSSVGRTCGGTWSYRAGSTTCATTNTHRRRSPTIRTWMPSRSPER